MTHRLVHLSDVHFGQETAGNLTIHEDVRDTLVADCRSFARVHGPAKGILLAGDTAFSGKRNEYRRAAEWLDAICDAAGCSRTSVLVVPGNHDVDITEIDFSGKVMHERLRAGTPEGAQSDLSELGRGDEESNPLLPKLRAYREFAEQYGCSFESPARPFWKRDFPLEQGRVLRLLGLSSVQISVGADTRGELILGNQQFTIPRIPGTAYLVMMHHPLHWFKDEIAAKQHLHSRARVLMVGHEHLTDIEKIADAQGFERLVLYSGATSPPENTALYGYTYNWLEIADDDSTGVPRLLVTVHARRWAAERTEFVADTGRLGEQTHRVFAVACPEFESAAVPVAVHPATDGGPSAQQTGTNVSEHPMISDDDARFARLRLLFWRHLDWAERIRVLVKLDLLPKALEKPLPQTLERLALNKALRERKLAALWSAVMEVIPEEQREENPFKPGEE